MTAGAEATPGGAVSRNPHAPPTDTGEALGLPASSLTLTFGVGPALLRQARPRRAAARRARAAADVHSSTRSTRRCPAATCASRRAPTTRRSPCTPSATSSGSASAPRRCGGRSSGSAARRRRRRARPRRATSSASRTAPATSRPRTPTCSTSTSGCRPATARPGSRAAATWSPGGSGCTSRSGTARRSPSRRASSAGTRARARPPGRRSRVRRAEPREPDGPIAPDAHIRLAAAQNLGGVQILRRGYNFVDGSDGQGHLNAGLFFLAFMRDPHTQFVPMQRALAGKRPADGVHRAHRLGGVRDPARAGAEDYWGQALLEACRRGRAGLSAPASSASRRRRRGRAGRRRRPRRPARRRARRRRTRRRRRAARPPGRRPRAWPRRRARTAAPPPPARSAAAPAGRPARAVRLVSLAANATAGWPSATPSTLDVRCFSARFSSSQRCSWRCAVSTRSVPANTCGCRPTSFATRSPRRRRS